MERNLKDISNSYTKFTNGGSSFETLKIGYIVLPLSKLKYNYSAYYFTGSQYFPNKLHLIPSFPTKQIARWSLQFFIK